MSWSWTLYRYLALQFLAGVAMVYGVFLVLAFSKWLLSRMKIGEGSPVG